MSARHVMKDGITYHRKTIFLTSRKCPLCNKRVVGTLQFSELPRVGGVRVQLEYLKNSLMAKHAKEHGNES